MKKKFLTVLLSALIAVTAVVGLASCKEESGDGDYTLKPVAKADLKVGFIFLHDETSTYDLNFINAAKKVQEDFNLTDSQVIFKRSIPEGQECYEAAADLVDKGCDVIFADSFGHEDFMIQAAAKFPKVRFCHATGTKAHTYNLPNIHNAFASIYEGRYLAGVTAGMKLNEMIAAGKFTAEEAKMGYVGAYPYAEVKSGYTSFYLGAQSVCPTVKMDVTFTNSWYDPTAEGDGARLLIEKGAKLISQHADSMGAPSACETAKVPNVSYNGSTMKDCPETYLVSSRIDWTPYFTYMIDSVIAGTKIVADWCGDLATGSVVLTELNANVVAAGTQEAVDAAKGKLMSGELHVFDVSKFTVSGKNLTEYMADVNTDDSFAKDTQVIKNGYFQESVYRSAPYFDIDIDGITLLTK